CAVDPGSGVAEASESNNACNPDSVTVVAPPSIAKAFGAASILVGNTTTLTFTITNPNTTVGLTGVSVSDTLPSGLGVADGTIANACGSGSTVTTTAATGVISLTGGSIAANSNCSFQVTVTGTSGGVKNNTSGAVSATNGGTGTTAAASISVNQAPAITSANSTTFTVGQAGTFTVTTSGSPAPSITRGGAALPSGVTFVDNGNGTGTLSGTPGAGTGGVYALTFTATN